MRTTVTDTEPQDIAGDGMDTVLPRIAVPDFWPGPLSHPPRWAGVCKDEITFGLYAVVATDLDMLTAALLLDRAWRAATVSHERRNDRPSPNA